MARDDSVTGATLLADGEQLLTWSDDGAARIWPIGGGPPTATVSHDDSVTGATLLADGEQLLTWSDDRTAKIWPIGGGPPTATFSHDHPFDRPFTGPTVLADGEQLLTWSDAATSQLWDISVDLETPVAKQILEYEVRTGTALNASGRVRVLSVAEWEKRLETASDTRLN